MRKDMGIVKRVGLALALLISLANLCAPSAEAVIRDKAMVGKLQDERNSLKNREGKLLEDYDDLQQQIHDLQRRDNDPKMIDQLSRDADKKYSDLKQVRYDLRQVEEKLL